MGRTTTLVLLSSLAGTNTVLAGESTKSLLDHFKAQGKSNAHLQSATNLPVSASKPIFHMDLSGLGEDASSIYEAMMNHEASMRLLDENGDVKYPFLLCGSQQTASTARDEIRHYFEGRADVSFASRLADVACWRVPLLSSQAAALASSSSFYHVTQVPSFAKVSPGMASIVGGRAAASYQALNKGISIKFESGVSTERRAELFKKWQDDKFGLLSGDHMKKFFPASDSAHLKKSAWKHVRTLSEAGKCKDILKVFLSKSSKHSDYLVRVEFEKLASGDMEGCALAAMAYLVTQPEVRSIEPVPNVALHAAVPKKGDIKISEPTKDSSSSEKVPVKLIEAIKAGATDLKVFQSEDSIRPMNTIATTALQSGDESEPNPFWSLGINGTGQFVEVADTGFDDASCFFRPIDSASQLTGSFNADVQVARSAYNVATTDTSLRKVVQYVMRDTTNAVYGYDYASGHGTHCAGI
jgi:hypothetical protein